MSSHSFVRIVHFRGGLYLVDGTFDSEKSELVFHNVHRMNLFAQQTQTSYAIPNITNSSTTSNTVYYTGNAPATGSLSITWVVVPTWERVSGWDDGLRKKTIHELTIDLAKDNLAFTP